MDNDSLISTKEASKILGFKTNNYVTNYIKEGLLNTYEIKGSKRKWLSKEEVYSIPIPLPVPPPDEYFPKLKVNERWKKKSTD